MTFFQRLLARVRNRRFDDELAEELRYHEDLKHAALVASGMSPEEARVEARRALGNMTLAREDSRFVWIAPWTGSVAQDVRYAVRLLRRQPAHSATAIAVLVIAVGLNTSLFTALKGVALEPWPARDPDRVVTIRARTRNEGSGPSVNEYRFFREHARSFSGIAAHAGGGQTTVRAPGRSETAAHSVWMSANFMDVLGARMQAGTGLIPDDDDPGRHRAAAILSHFFWRTYFNSDPGAVGQTIAVNGQPLTVIGILEPRIDGLSREVDLWMPLGTMPALQPDWGLALDGPGAAACCINAVGRLAKGVNPDSARQELQLLHERFAQSAGKQPGRIEMRGTAQTSTFNAEDFAVIGALGAALALILALACANVGNLQLARGLARRREIATRLAIGASRGRVIRQLMTEGIVLAAVAGALSIAIAAVLPGVVLRYVGDEIPPALAGRFVPDWQVMLFTAGVCLSACLVFALVPALHATVKTVPFSALGRGSTTRARFPLRSAMLAIQIATCMALLVGAGLITRAIAHAMSFDPGFQVQGIDMISVTLPQDAPADQKSRFARRVLDALEREGSTSVAMCDFGPMSSAKLMAEISLDGPQGVQRTVLKRGVSRDYFFVLGVPLVQGRMFDSHATGEVVVNEAFVRAFLPDGVALGRVVREMRRRGGTVVIAPGQEPNKRDLPPPPLTIVGVVRDSYLTSLERVDPVLFRPVNSGRFVARGGPETIARVRATALELNAAAVVTSRPLSEDLRRYLQASRIGATLAWTIGLLGLLLASVGVFGVFAYAVEERRREIGVRLALGAGRREILRMLAATSGRAMMIGVIAGSLLSLACGPVLRSYLYGLSPLDPRAYGLVVALLGTAAVLATFVPARRAIRVDPAVTLRDE